MAQVRTSIENYEHPKWQPWKIQRKRRDSDNVINFGLVEEAGWQDTSSKANSVGVPKY